MLYKNLCASLLVLGLLSSCALHSTSTGLTKYQQAVLCYEAKNYYEALQLFEEVLPLLRGKREEASVCFYQAYCSFHQKKYEQSADGFKYFRDTFLGDLRVEEAMYMQGHALYLASPDVRLDQTLTQESGHVFRSYLNHYPGGVYVHEARVQLGVLENKLALKDLNNAKLYYQMAHYQASVVTLENFHKDFPHSSYNEEAAYLKADAQYHYFREIEKTHKHVEHDREAINHYRGPLSFPKPNIVRNADEKIVGTLEEEEEVLQYRYFEEVREVDEQEQLSMAIKYCQEFLGHYPDSQYTLAVGEMYEKLSSVNKMALQTN